MAGQYLMPHKHHLALHFWCLSGYKGSVVVVEIAIRAGNKAPQIVDAVDTVVGGLEKDRQDGVWEKDKIVIGGLSIDGEEERLGCCKGWSDCFGSQVAGIGNGGELPFLKTRNVYWRGKTCRDRYFSKLWSTHVLGAKAIVRCVCCMCCMCCPKLVVNGNWWCGAGQMLVSLLDGSSCVP